MAMFIPEWNQVSGRDLHIKRALKALDDAYVVRRPLRPGACAADFFVQHRVEGWLAVAVEDAPFAQIDPAQLFESAPRVRFEQRLGDLQRLGVSAGHPGTAVASLVLLWKCSTDEAHALMNGCSDRPGFASRERFAEMGEEGFKGLLTPVLPEIEQTLLATYFPEAEIPAVCTTRRFFHRDNSARLQRFFLDHEQEWASKLDLELPDEQTGTANDLSVRLVNGVAGSGKTLIALHRALLLAELLPAQRVLMLIHNTPVVADLRYRLHRMRGAVPANLEVVTFYAWASRQWHRISNERLKAPDDPRQVPNLVKQLRSRWPELEPSDAQLVDEMDFINETLIADEAGYAEASRAGRKFALRPKDRLQVWALYQTLTQALRSSGLRMWSALPRELCLAREGHDGLDAYHHILIDEAQFFAPSWFQVVKLSLERHGQLFMCADPSQGFLKRRLSWKTAGLDVAGRTKKLRKSYRTTKAILSAASGLLAALNDEDGEDYLQPDFSGMQQGTRPKLIYSDSPQDAMDRVVNELAAAALNAHVPLDAMLLLYGENVPKLGLYHQLCERLGDAKVWWLNKQDQKEMPPGGYGNDHLRIANLDTATGLECGVLFLVGIEDLFSDGAVAGLNEDEQAERREQNARKLYMAMTRAGQQLVVVASQRLPEAMEALFDVVA